MTLEELIASDPGGTIVAIDNVDGQAMLFRREDLDPDWAEEELETWLETAEEEEGDPDLVLFGYHPVEPQVERLLYFRRSEGPEGPIYALDVDGTAVPGTLTEYASNFDVFTPSQ